MRKILNAISSGPWPYVILLAMIGGLVWFGVAFNERGHKIDELKSIVEEKDAGLRQAQGALRQAQDGIDSLGKVLKTERGDCKKSVESIQKVLLEMRDDIAYKDDLISKLESGVWCVEKTFWGKRKKKLVKCVEGDNS